MLLISKFRKRSKTSQSGICTYSQVIQSNGIREDSNFKKCNDPRIKCYLKFLS